MARISVFLFFLVFLSSCNFFKDIISAALVKRFASFRRVGDLELMDAEFKKKFPYNQKIFIQCTCKEEVKDDSLKSDNEAIIINPKIMVEEVWTKGDSVGLYFYYVIWDFDLCQCRRYKKGDVAYWKYYYLLRENLIAFEKDSAMCFNINKDFGSIGYFLKKHKMGWIRRQLLLAKLSMLRRGAIVSIYELPW